MWKTRIIVSAVFLLLVLGAVPLQFAQDARTGGKDANAERRGVVLGLVRTINTIEVTELDKYGSYAPWPILVAHHQEEFNGWLKRFYSSGEPNTHFGDMPGILPGWNLRLNVQTDGKGYVLLLNDASDKDGFAWVSDESGLIRQGKALQ
jgi:hypothetical protein